MRSMRGLEIAVLCVCLGAVAGCSVRGPGKVKGGRRLYNVAVQETNKEQMLLNIVRLRSLQKQGELTIGYEGDPEEGAYVLEIASEALDWPETRELTELLGLESNRGRYRIVPGAGHSEPNTIGIAPRSLTGSFFYVSHGVEVPQEDLAAGRVTVTRKPDAEEFDWSRFGRGLLAIRSSEDRPDDAAVAVLYHDTWFYIADNDIDSKATFSLLMQLFALSAGEPPSTAPILTLSVSVGPVRWNTS